MCCGFAAVASPDHGLWLSCSEFRGRRRSELIHVNAEGIKDRFVKLPQRARFLDWLDVASDGSLWATASDRDVAVRVSPSTWTATAVRTDRAMYLPPRQQPVVGPDRSLWIPAFWDGPGGARVLGADHVAADGKVTRVAGLIALATSPSHQLWATRVDSTATGPRYEVGPLQANGDLSSASPFVASPTLAIGPNGDSYGTSNWERTLWQRSRGAGPERIITTPVGIGRPTFDDRGRLWFSQLDGASRVVYRIDPASGRQRKIRLPVTGFGDPIWAGSAMWLSTRTGLLRILLNGDVRTYRVPGLPRRGVQLIAWARDDRSLWMATTGLLPGRTSELYRVWVD